MEVNCVYLHMLRAMGWQGQIKAYLCICTFPFMSTHNKHKTKGKNEENVVPI